MSDNSLVISGSTFIEPAATLAKLRERYGMFNQFVKEILHDGTDYQVIPGTGTKPSLVKPGAEKLCALFGLSAHFQTVDIVEDWTGEAHNGEPFFYYRYRCALMRGDLMVAECEGSCNSWEKKYRYRSADLVCPVCNKATIIKGKEEYGGGWVCFAKRGGCGAKFKDTDKAITDQPRGLVPNVDIADQVNTLQKMAQKRAFVGATLIATNASEYFTQDIEDMPQFVEAVVVEYPPTQPTAKTAQAPTPAPVATEPAAQPERPYDPATLKAGLNKKANRPHAKLLPEELQRVTAALEVALGGEDQRHEFIRWLTDGKTQSIKDLTPGMVLTLHDWLKPTYNRAAKVFEVTSEYATAEATAAHREWLSANGAQGELPQG